MRVLNDDSIAPKRGFGAHPHSDMEVVSIVLTGSLRHQDNLGNVGVTSWGQIQRMTAGNGIIHTEYSDSDSETLNLLQMWFVPDQAGLEPSYEISAFDVDALGQAWVPVVSKTGAAGVAKIHQDMTIYLTELAAGEARDYDALPGRRTFVFMIHGSASLNGEIQLDERDEARIEDVTDLSFRAVQPARIMLIDLP